jgi:hypothetical protein
MDSDLRLHDEVLQRFVQIIQEAMLLGVDCADIMRQVRLARSLDDECVLVLTEDYKRLTKEHHVKLLEEAEKISREMVET